MGVIWRKVWRDLARSKVRTALVVLSTAVGVFALGLVIGLSGVLRSRIVESYRASVAAHITFWGGPFSRDTVAAVRREPGVAAAEGEIGRSFRWKLDGEEAWRDGDVVARADYSAQRMNLLRLQGGRWPDAQVIGSAQRVLAVEHMSSRFFGVSVGTAILVELGERERSVPVAGVVRAPVVLPPEWGGDAMFFATPETAAWLSGSEDEDFNRLNVILETYGEEAAKKTAKRIEDRLERMGLDVGGYEISDPDKHWVQEFVDATMIILMVMGILSLGLSAFLIVNTMNGIVVQQVWQIGVMKAVGATLSRVARTYLAMALVYGLLALPVAALPGVVGAHLLALWLLGLLNVQLGTFQVNLVAVCTQAAVGVAVPLAAALVPVIGGVRITVREAIGSHGIGSDFGQGRLDRLIAYVRGLPRPLALGVRNAFRRKMRVALTLATLVFSGAMFAVVLSTADSLDNTVVNSFSLGEDVALRLDRPRRAWRATEIAEGVPGVVEVELWSKRHATLSMAPGEERPVELTGVPADSVIFSPNIVVGRSLRPGDGHALVFTFRLAEERGFQVGETITLDIGGRESEWTVVGLYLNIDSTSDEFFVPLDAFGRETGTYGWGRQLKVLTQRDDIASQERVIEGLESAFAAQRIEVVGSWSVGEELVESRASFSLLTSVLLAMVVLTAAVGGIGLASTMSMNVVERRRDIGVMRAIGAPSLAIAGTFVAEGVVVGVLSWLLAVPPSVPAAHLFSDLIGDILLEMPLDFEYSAGGMLLWLLVVVLLSALASLGPALRAAQMSVREALAYE